MKTSNKILLGTFFTVLLILISVHVALYAKYKNGDYTLVTDEMWPTNLATYSLDNVKYVSLNNIENVSVRAADTSRLRYEPAKEDEENILSFTKRGDTLFVLGKSKTNNIGRWYRQTELAIGNDMPVQFINSNIHFAFGGNIQPFSLRMDLDKSRLELFPKTAGLRALENVRINAINNSTIDLKGISMKRFDLTLKNSMLDEDGLAVDSFNLITDAASHIQMSGENLSKTKIQVHE